MKIKFRSRLNTMLSALIGFFAASCSQTILPSKGMVCMYGVPTNLIDVQGKVTDQAGRSLEGIHIRLTTTQQDKNYQFTTDADGKFTAENLNFFGLRQDTLKVIATDTTHTYSTDSVQVPLSDLKLKADKAWKREYSAKVRIKLKPDNQ